MFAVIDFGTLETQIKCFIYLETIEKMKNYYFHYFEMSNNFFSYFRGSTTSTKRKKLVQFEQKASSMFCRFLGTDYISLEINK
jgi:hypothetical protein